MNEWCKCNFCSNDTLDGCDWCSHYSGYKPNANDIIEKAKETGISVADVIKLIEYCKE